MSFGVATIIVALVTVLGVGACLLVAWALAGRTWREPMPDCTACGQPIPATARICPRCGRKVDARPVIPE
jgi:predicted amidophosphoribosyltransferase